MSKAWEQAEKRYVKKHGGRRTRRSGAGDIEKGDALCEELGGHMAEVKSSERVDEKRGAYIVLEQAWFTKAKEQALMQGVDPVVAVSLGFPPQEFRWHWQPHTMQSGAVAFGRTCKVYLDELMHGGYAQLIVKGEVWVRL